ncbi:MAG: metallophosphoesterase, partial [Candidatus Marinimicrobia bacterium]|nr:metallophosphoesterase [Candidatus Neomarinimicrobiota bacterium]
MSKKLSGILFILCLVLCNACGRDVIRIGIVGDQFGAYSADESYAIMEKGVDRLLALSPDIVLHVGDMVETIRGIKSFEDYELNFRTATGIMERFSCPWLLAVGDHDVVPLEFKALSEDRSREKWFMDLIRETDLPIGDRPYYSYDHRGYHFIVLYSIENMHTDPRWGSIYLNKISEEQLKWLEEDLRRSAKSKGNIVLVHHPHWYVWQNWQPVHDLLKNAKTLAVIAGHYHYDFFDRGEDGIRDLVMGSTGGVIKETDSHTGGQEIALLTLDKKGIAGAQLFDVET